MYTRNSGMLFVLGLPFQREREKIGLIACLHYAAKDLRISRSHCYCISKKTQISLSNSSWFSSLKG